MFGGVEWFLEVLCFVGFWSPALLMFSENSTRLVGYDQAQSLFMEYTGNVHPKAEKMIINLSPAELLTCLLNLNR